MIVLLLLAGIAAAAVPAVADPVTAAIGSLAEEPERSEEDAAPVAVAPGPEAVPSTTTTPPPPTQPSLPAEVETVFVEEPPPTTTSTTTPPPTTTTTALPGSVPPAAGTYPYSLRYIDDEETDEASGRMVVQSPREVEDETRQTHVYTDEVYGTESQSLAWRDDGVYLRAADDGSGAEGNTCDFEPDVLLYPLPTTVGHAWETDTACKGDPDDARLERSAEVERADRIEIGDREIDVFVITAVREGSDEEGSYTINETIYFAPSFGLDVRTETDYRITPAGESPIEWREEYELTSLRPQ